tara:strand:- start:691 stop:819 length:129 start_codon:yes stop_codon:yes gene_type:complete
LLVVEVEVLLPIQAAEAAEAAEADGEHLLELLLVLTQQVQDL